MKIFKALSVVGILLCVGMAFATDVTPLPYGFPVMGTPVDNTFKATLDNTAKSIQTLAETAGITWAQNGQTPHGVWVSVEDNNARFGTTGTGATAVVGHVLAKDTVPVHFAGSYATVQITLER